MKYNFSTRQHKILNNVGATVNGNIFKKNSFFQRIQSLVPSYKLPKQKRFQYQPRYKQLAQEPTSNEP